VLSSVGETSLSGFSLASRQIPRSIAMKAHMPSRPEVATTSM
jgi:hypothetical protein